MLSAMFLHILRSCSPLVSPFLFRDFLSGVPLSSNVISIFVLLPKRICCFSVFLAPCNWASLQPVMKLFVHVTLVHLFPFCFILYYPSCSGLSSLRSLASLARGPPYFCHIPVYGRAHPQEKKLSLCSGSLRLMPEPERL